MHLLPLAIALLSATPAQSGEAADLRALLYRTNAPARVKDLGPDWLSMTVVRPAPMKVSGGGILGAVQEIYGGGTRRTRVVTRGEIVTIGGRKLLQAYRISPPQADFVTLMKKFEGNEPALEAMDPGAVIEMIAPSPTLDSPLALELIDLTSVLSLDGVAPFDPAKISRDDMDVASEAIQAAILLPVFAQARAKARAVSSVSNLRQLGLAAMMYAQDYDETLPPMTTVEQFQRASFPYTKNADLYKSPIPGVRYVPNPAASKVHLAAVEFPAEFILLYESKPDSSGTRGVLFSDGHVKRVKEADWPAVWQRGRKPAR